MLLPALNDTIVAVATGWEASAMGVVRLSGPEGAALAAGLGAPRPPRPPGAGPVWCAARLRLGDGLELPAVIMWFWSPRSYTGQDVVEFHLPGSLPLLRELSARLIALGARRALPGEFTARAFLTGRLKQDQVEGVLALMQGTSAAALREAARQSRGETRRAVERAADQIVALLARIEAGIDFVDEEDVRFITPAELAQELRSLQGLMKALGDPGAENARRGRPYVALAGLPNAGKSTLFNALLGRQRALVSPIVGTTRDVLSAEISVHGIAFVLQDCAGLGTARDELELATHLATERALEQADIVLWIHATDAAWTDRETDACARVPVPRRVLVRSKIDQPHAAGREPALPPFASVVDTCALDGTGLHELRSALARQLAGVLQGGITAACGPDYQAATAALGRAQRLVDVSTADLDAPELIALELRAAHAALTKGPVPDLDERVLARVFAEFCVGK